MKEEIFVQVEWIVQSMVREIGLMIPTSITDKNLVFVTRTGREIDLSHLIVSENAMIPSVGPWIQAETFAICVIVEIIVKEFLWTSRGCQTPGMEDFLETRICHLHEHLRLARVLQPILILLSTQLELRKYLVQVNRPDQKWLDRVEMSTEIDHRQGRTPLGEIAMVL